MSHNALLLKPNLLHCRFVRLVLFFQTSSCNVHTRGPRLCIDLWLLDLWLLDLWLLVRGSGTSSDILRKGSGFIVIISATASVFQLPRLAFFVMRHGRVGDAG